MSRGPRGWIVAWEEPDGGSGRRRGEVVSDLLFIGIMVAFFALAAVFVAACERIVGADTSYETPTEEVAEPHEAAA
jgi:hypothetical protein